MSEISASRFKIRKSLVNFLMGIPEDTMTDDVGLYRQWQHYSGFALKYPEDVADALEYLESVKNCPRSILGQLAAMDGYLQTENR